MMSPTKIGTSKQEKFAFQVIDQLTPVRDWIQAIPPIKFKLIIQKKYTLNEVQAFNKNYRRHNTEMKDKDPITTKNSSCPS